MWRRLRRWAVWTVGGFLLLTVSSVLALRFIPPVTSAFIVNGYVGAWLKGDFGWRAHQFWVAYSEISPQVKIAVIASEDQKFPDHFGFDLDQIDHGADHQLEEVDDDLVVLERSLQVAAHVGHDPVKLVVERSLDLLAASPLAGLQSIARDLARHDLDDGIRLPVAARAQHDAFVGPFHGFES